MVEDSPVRRPHLARLSTGGALLALAAVAVAVQVTGVRSGVHTAAASVPHEGSTTVAQPRATSTIDPTLTAAIRDRMSRSTAGAYDVVVDVAGVGRVVDINGGSHLLPASTEKLFTTLPLLMHRPQDRLVTTAAAATKPIAGVLHGDLVVHASGDPTVMGATLVSLAKQVHGHGVHRVSGRLVLDIGRLPTNRTMPGWKAAYVPWDVGPLSPFPVHEDVWRTSSSYVAHPTTQNLALLRQKLKDAGVTVAGSDVLTRGVSTPVVLASYTSPTIAGIVAHTLRWSDNFAAEMLLAVNGGLSQVTTVADAAGAAGTTTDGSGLSLQDRRSGRDEVALLHYAQTTSAAWLLQHSLPIACRTGTLEKEMCDTVAAGMVYAKTGTLDHVKALSGYTTDARGRLVTFAFLTTSDVSTSKAMNAIERSVIVLRHFGQ